MARKMHVVLEDDIDGSEAAETLRFSLDGVEYEIDLNNEHSAQLREAMSPWISSARRVGGRRSVRSAGLGAKGELSLIRSWARENGMEVSERGRISARVREAYAAAH